MSAPLGAGVDTARLPEFDSPEFIEALADALAPRVAAYLAALPAQPLPSPRLVDVTAVAEAIGMSSAYVYDHADELGAQRFGDGPKPRLRFDLEVALAAHSRSGSERSEPIESRSETEDPSAASRRRAPRLPAGLPATGSVLRSKPGGESCR